MKYRSAVLESIEYLAPPVVWTSAMIEEKLRPLYERLRLPEGRLELMTGIRERRFWDGPARPSAIAAQAGSKALERSRIPVSEIGVCIHSSVCRDMLEPATASFAHRLMGLSPATQVFDVSNACLGFLNAINLIAGMVDAGQVRAGIVVSGEDGRPLLERTIDILLSRSLNRREIKPYFANLTIGAGAVAAVVCHESLAREGHRLLGGAAFADTAASDLCKGDQSGGAAGLEMQTDSEEMLHAGVALAKKTWGRFKSQLGWDEATPDRVVCHQVGSAHQRLLLGTLGLPAEKDFSTYQEFGNTGSAALPMTLARAAEEGAVRAGDRVALLGIGSGLNSLMMGVEW